MVQTGVVLHPELETIVRLGPILKDLIHSEVTLVISDCEKIISQIVASDVNFGDIENKQLVEQDPMVEVLRTRKIKVMTLPKEVYGVPFRGAIAPIFSKSGELLGTLSINTTLSNQVNLVEMASQLATSSETMHNSVNDINSSAKELNRKVDYLSNYQMEMFQQVENSAKMLDMINTVAKNTRILGFNAGIESARSGEAGKGFAVVAKEITKLADLSAHSVEEIRQLMRMLKLQVEQMKSIVQQTAEISHQQFEATSEISEIMKGFSYIIDEMERLAKKV